MNKRIDILLLSGEESGDRLAETLIHDLKETLPNVQVAGMGGKALAKTGMSLLVDNHSLSIIGLSGVIKQFHKILKAWKTLKETLIKHKPVVILIDYPGMNLRFAKLAKKHNCPVLYYVSPQIWAWKKGRIKTIKKTVDHMALLFSFEKAIYDKARIPNTVVGHPLTHPTLSDNRKTHSTAPSNPLIVLCPGSRTSEIQQHLPVLLESARVIKQHYPQARFTLIQARSVNASLINNLPEDISVAKQSALPTVFEQADAAILVSGTITLQAASYGLPSVVVYKTHPINHWIAKHILKISTIGLSNIVLGKNVSPELIQHHATAQSISTACIQQIQSPQKKQSIQAAMAAMPKHSNAALIPIIQHMLNQV